MALDSRRTSTKGTDAPVEGVGVPVRVLRRWMNEGLIVVQGQGDSLDRRKDGQQRVLVSRIDEMRREISELTGAAKAQQQQIEDLKAVVQEAAARQASVAEAIASLARSAEGGNSTLWSKIARSLNP